MKCRFCHKTLRDVFIDLGHQPPANSFLTKEQLEEPEIYYPLKVYVCACGLVQIPEMKKASEIFREDYPYFSSQSPSNVSHAKEFAEMILERFPHIKRVVEIGSNDGYMLQWFKQMGCGVLGFEPAEGPASIAESKGINTVKRFFGCDFVGIEGNLFPVADLICSINTIAHQPDINDFVEGMKIALAPEGIITAEFPHLMNLVRYNQFDTIYHEHYNYFSLDIIMKIFKKHRLTVFDVDEIPEHGGSLRIYACHEGERKPLKNIKRVLRKESDTLARAKFLQHRAENIRRDLLRFLVTNGAEIVAYGAPAKGNTLLNYCRINRDLIHSVVDKSPHKQGKYLPGSHIPVLGESRIKCTLPEYVLILPWNLKEEIMEQLSYIRKWKAKFVTAIPRLEVL